MSSISRLKRIVVLAAAIVAMQWFLHTASIASEQYITGDINLDASLLKINARYKNNTRLLVSALSKEYLIPKNKLNDVINGHDFTPADVFLTVASADLTGQPVAIVFRAYLENKAAGWAYVLEQLNIGPGSTEFDQLVEDAASYD